MIRIKAAGRQKAPHLNLNPDSISRPAPTNTVRPSTQAQQARMLRRALRGTAAARLVARGRVGLMRPVVPTMTTTTMTTTHRTLAAAAAAGGRGKGGGSKEDKVAGGAAAAAKLNALTMAIKRIEHLHGKGACI